MIHLFPHRSVLQRVGIILLLVSVFFSIPINALIVDGGGGGGGGGGIVCTNGYQLSTNGQSCVCPAPKTVCGSSCGTFNACQSGIPSRRSIENAFEDVLPRTSRSGAKALCPPRKTACGIANADPGAWECVDTNRDLFSCGGCAVGGPFDSERARRGRDCSVIEAVGDVRCGGGRCVVESCMSGYVPSTDASACVVQVERDGKGMVGSVLRGGLKSLLGVGV